MVTWQTPNVVNWFTRLIQAFWNATNYLWNDQVCTWDAISDDDWQTPNAGTWFNKN